MKKLIVTLVILIALLGTFVFGYYFIQYPDEFKLSQYVQDAEWRTFVIVIALIFGAASLSSYVPFRTYSFARKFMILFASFQVIFLLFLLIKMVDTYLMNRSNYKELLLEYRKKADLDMKSGVVEIEYVGGLEMPLNEKEQKLRQVVDSIMMTYGITYRNSGCVFMPAIVKAQENMSNIPSPILTSVTAQVGRKGCNKKLKKCKITTANIGFAESLIAFNSEVY